MAEHLYSVDNRSEDGFQYTVEAHDLLIDIKVLLKEYYAATFNNDGQTLIMRFNNGQVFHLTLKEKTI